MNSRATREARHKAYRKVRTALAQGRLVRPSVCEACGEPPSPSKDGRSKIQAHHHAGYDRPLDVKWLCAKCHRDETPYNTPRGEQVVNSKLRESDIREIRSYALSPEALASKYQISIFTVSRIRQRHDWGWVSEEGCEPPRGRLARIRAAAKDAPHQAREEANQ